MGLNSSTRLLTWLFLGGWFGPPALGVSTGLVWTPAVLRAAVAAGSAHAHFAFAVVNASPGPVEILAALPSCGCTAPSLPATPWRLPPGGRGTMGVDIDLTGKHGLIRKSVSVQTDHGWQTLWLEITVPETVMSPAERNGAIALARADRQAVFRGDCAKCHAAELAGRSDQGLFAAACAICHESSQRASMVPDLRVAPPGITRDLAYWTSRIREGRPGTLMPAFAKAAGGPLNDEQIDSLAGYLALGVPASAAAE